MTNIVERIKEIEADGYSLIEYDEGSGTAGPNWIDNGTIQEIDWSEYYRDDASPETIAEVLGNVEHDGDVGTYANYYVITRDCDNGYKHHVLLWDV